MIKLGLAPTRARAEALVLAGEVMLNGVVAESAGAGVPAGAEISLRPRHKFVGRGGTKLDHALASFSIAAERKVCADVGACTGGFTDVLLQRGALRVYAIDVAYGELAWRLRTDSRVVVMERTNARLLQELPEPVSLVVMDVSFISLRLILPNVTGWAKGGPLVVVALVKPQFEAQRAEVPPGGVVKDAQVHRRVLEELWGWCLEHQLGPCGLIRSPILGADGNTEFFVKLMPGSSFQGSLEELISAQLVSNSTSQTPSP